MSASTLPASNMPSPSQIQREYSNLREIRRRSVSTEKGSLMVDPDLPELSPTSTSPIGQQGYWSEPTVPEVFSPVSEEAKVAEEAMDDPTNLFWVPAHLHPELAPGEFRAFLKAHTRSLPQNDIPASPLSPSTHSQTTVAGSGLGRKKSMLSRQYQPKENDGVENEPVPLPSRMASGRRNRNSIFRENDGPQLTIDDLQKLEELAEEASKSDDPSKLRSVLRRSLSLNVAPAFLDTVDDIAELDEADAPIIVPRPGQTLRRAARTKIRKANLPGDGGGHRFPATRKTRRTSAGRSTEDATSERPISYSDETAIFDSYGAASPDISDEGHGDFESNPPSELDHEVQVIATPALPIEVQPPTPPQPQEARAPALVHPTPQRHLAIPSPISVATQPARTPSPVSPHHPSASPPESPKSAVEPTSPTASLATSQETSSTTIHVPSTPTASTSTTTLVHPAHEKHEPHPHAAGRSAPAASPTKPAFHVTPPTKEKKGGLFSKKKDNHKLSKSKQSDNASVKSSVSEREKEKEKEGFFGSLFGGKKKAEESPHAGGLFSGGGAGQAAAAKLLGASKSGKDMHRPTSPGPGGLNNFSRYPIHVERAVYRLSHIKLASPRRPLYEQVLISNLMFWYLGIINRPAGEDPPPKKAKEEKEEAPPTPEHRPQSAGTPGKEPSERDSLLKRGNSFGRQSSPPHPIPHSPPHAATLRSSSPPPPVANHAPPKAAGSLNHNQRSAEMPIRSPQYEVQHRMIAQGQAAPGHEGMSRPGMPNGQHPGQSRQPQPGQPGAHSGMPGGSAGRPRTGSPPPGAMNPFTESHPQFAQGAESRPPMEGRAPREGRGTTPETRVLSPRGPESLGRGPPPQGANLPNGQAPAGPIPPGAHPSLVPQNPGQPYHLPNRVSSGGNAPRRTSSASATPPSDNGRPERAQPPPGVRPGEPLRGPPGPGGPGIPMPPGPHRGPSPGTGGIQPGQIFRPPPGPGFPGPPGPGRPPAMSPPPGWNLPPGAMPPQQAWMNGPQARPSSAPIPGIPPGAPMPGGPPMGMPFGPGGPPPGVLTPGALQSGMIQPGMVFPGGPMIPRPMNPNQIPPGMRPPGAAMPHPPHPHAPPQMQIPRQGPYPPPMDGRDVMRSPPPEGDPRRLPGRSVSASGNQPGPRQPPPGGRPDQPWGRPGTEEDLIAMNEWQEMQRRFPPETAAPASPRR